MISLISDYIRYPAKYKRRKNFAKYRKGNQISATIRNISRVPVESLIDHSPRARTPILCVRRLLACMLAARSSTDWLMAASSRFNTVGIIHVT